MTEHEVLTFNSVIAWAYARRSAGRVSPAKPWLDNRHFRIRQLPEKIRITAACRWRMRQRASYGIGNVVAKVLLVIY